jgi:aminopeptidase N
MWINEGMATFSAYLFLEWQYGKKRYIQEIKNEHEPLLHKLHHQEGGFRAVSGVPHNLTYGTHVYKKGADVAHSLRTYMGDTAFFNAVKYVMTQSQFQSVNSAQLRTLLETSSGQNLSSFFNNWVFAKGWPHFAIDSVKYVTVGTNSVNAIISLKQKVYGAPTLYSNVPLELSFFKNDWSRVTKKVIMSGATQTFTVNIPYTPVYHALNYDNKIPDATSSQEKVIKLTGASTWSLSKAYTTIVNKGADSSLLRIVHNFVKPDPFKNNPQGHKLSDQHYWTVEGILSPGFFGRLTLNYDGNKTVSGNYAYLDTLLTPVNGDSIRVFYRKNAQDDWKLVKHCSITVSGMKSGYIQVDTLKLGEYTMGNSTDLVVINSLKDESLSFKAKIYPNPANNTVKIELPKMPEGSYKITIHDVNGKEVISKVVKDKINSVNVSALTSGTYFVRLEQEDHLLYAQKLLIE